MADQLAIPAGMVTITTYGSVTGTTVRSIMDLRSFSEKNGLQNVAWEITNGSLVEKARNDAVRMMMDKGLQWLAFADADMSFAPDALIRLLQHAYQPNSVVDIIGGYCTLKGEWSLPTIDTGTGTWESHFPGNGLIEVIRTGAAFLLVKRHVFERMTDPWFRMRVPMRPIDILHEMDNFARIKLNGVNPFRGSAEWEKLEANASADPSTHTFVPAEVGEDSGFCDRARAMGFRIFVDTDVQVGHVDMKVLGPADHKLAADNARRMQRQLSGMLS